MVDISTQTMSPNSVPISAIIYPTIVAEYLVDRNAAMKNENAISKKPHLLI